MLKMHTKVVTVNNLGTEIKIKSKTKSLEFKKNVIISKLKLMMLLFLLSYLRTYTTPTKCLKSKTKQF